MLKIGWITFSLFIIHSNSSIYADALIRYKLLTNEQETIFDLKKSLESHGLVQNQHNYNVIFCDNVHYQKAVQAKRPIIFLDAPSQSIISQDARYALINNPYVKAVFKNFILRMPELHNATLCGSTYHLSLINNYTHEGADKSPGQLTNEQLSKIYQVHWLIRNSPFGTKAKSAKDYAIEYDKERSIDVSFMAAIKTLNTGINAKLYAWHREQAFNKLKVMTNAKSIKTFLSAGRGIPYSKYLKILKQSKIVVSPWGFGEWCYRDMEAMHCGAIVIKPDTSFVYSFPDIFLNDITYVPCKADFSDLEEKIEYILQNYELFTTMRETAKKILLDVWDMDVLVQKFVHSVKSVLR